jgi:predicted exporter
MNFRRRQFLGWGVLAVFALAGLAWLAQLDLKTKISTDVLDLVPTDARATELTLIRQLASQAEARTMLIALTDAQGAPVPAAVTQAFAAELARSPAFAQAVPVGDTAARDALGKELFARRFTLLFPQWLEEQRAAFASTGMPGTAEEDWLVKAAADRLGKFLNQPEALAFQDVVPADPLLLMPGLVERLQGVASAATGPEQGLIWAQLAVSPLSEAGQGPAFLALVEVAEKVRAEFPGLRVADTGVNRFAAASRARIEAEVKWINTLSFFAVLGVAAVFIRSVHRGLHLVPVVLLSLLGGWVGVTLMFELVHVLVFVVGSLLTGVAIDYGFYLYMQPPVGPDEDYWEKVRRLAKPLLASCLTTVAGFALLLFSEFPLIRQLGVFVGVGLVSALAAAVIYFSTVKNSFLETRTFRGGQALSPRLRSNARRVLGVAWLLALPGLALLQWRDDIRELEIPSVELKREDARIRALFGQSEGQSVYLTYGTDVLAARATLENFNVWLREASGGRARAFSLGAVIPAPAAHAAAAEFVHANPQFAERLVTALGQQGFDAEAFAPFATAYAEQAGAAAPSDLAAAVTALRAHLTGPMGLFLSEGKPLSWFVTLVSEAPSVRPPPELDSVGVNQLESLNQVFGHYRSSALRLSAIGLGVVGLGVFAMYGWRDGWRIFAIPCGACLGMLGLFGWVGVPLNLFHLLAAFLGVCLTHNYSIFSATSAYRSEGTPVSVRMSALTTAAAFGVLALSGIPVVRALGTTVAGMVLMALLVIELEHLSTLGKK